ncbi:DUF4956 domain-containing protein [Sorangium sp. So ce1078]|uniref:DUF4956 domain-containing protein n=1 Tax=Sorangium sp. So ce1078 TaxID=3133329 RepID=UPI003F639EB0
MNELSEPVIAGRAFEWRKAVVALLLAFGLGQAVAVVYMATFRGLSYARTTVHGMAMGSVITCMLMLAVDTNIAAGIGVAGGLSVVRFRTALRDPRDIIFVFAALGVGITGYGARRQPDGLLRFVAPSGQGAEEQRGPIVGFEQPVLQALAPTEIARVASIHVGLNDEVAPGQVVAMLDTSAIDAEIAVAQAEAAQLEAEARAEQSLLAQELDMAVEELPRELARQREEHRQVSAEAKVLGDEVSRVKQLVEDRLAVLDDLSRLNVQQAGAAALVEEKPRTLGLLARQIEVAEQLRREARRQPPEATAKLQADLLLARRNVELLEQRRASYALLARPSEGRYLIVSDDTGHDGEEDEGAPWPFAMFSTGAVDPEPAPVEGIDELVDVDVDGSLAIASTPSTADGDAGALFRVDSPQPGDLAPRLVQRFPGLKPEGIAPSLSAGKLMIVFDAGANVRRSRSSRGAAEGRARPPRRAGPRARGLLRAGGPPGSPG